MTAKKTKAAKPKRDRPGQPPHVPTDETNAKVQALCGFGLSEGDVADYLDITVPTLRKHYSPRLRKARRDLMALAGGGIFTALQKKEPWAIKYLHGTLGKKYGWTERIEIVLPKDVFGAADPSRLTDEQWKTFVELLAIMGVDLMQHAPDYRAGVDAKLIGVSSAA